MRWIACLVLGLWLVVGTGLLLSRGDRAGLSAVRAWLRSASAGAAARGAGD